jgi:hypothetical protein
MTQIVPILTHTPPWVWVVLALLLWLGMLGLKPRTVALPRVLLTPAVFITWGLVALAAAARSSPLILLDWAVLAACGIGLALATVRFEGLRAERGVVHLPGSRLPLIRNLAIFGAKYTLAVAMARHPEQRGQLVFWDLGISGLSAGYFLGWLFRFVLAYRHAGTTTERSAA